MRLREFISEAPMGSGGGALGQDIATGVGTLAGTVNDYIQLLFKWRKEAPGNEKDKLEKGLKDLGDKLTPKQKENMKKRIAQIDKKLADRKATYKDPELTTKDFKKYK